MIDYSDKKLLDAIGQKDKKAFEFLYHKYARLVQTWALKNVADKDLAEDIAQNFWIIVWESPQVIKTDENGNAKNYLLRYFTYRMLDYIKSAAARILGNESKMEEISRSFSYTHVIEDLEVSEIHQLIDSAINGLPGFTREVFGLLWEENYSVKEVAMKLNVSEKVIRSNYNKAVNAIRNRLSALQSDEKKRLGQETALLLLIWLNLFR